MALSHPMGEEEAAPALEENIPDSLFALLRTRMSALRHIGGYI
jgi:hypothetical protein